MKYSVQEIINKINKIVNPGWKFEMDDFYGDKFGLPYPSIESLDLLHWKKKDCNLTKDEEKIQLKMIKDIKEVKAANIIKIMSFGKYIQVILLRINENLISDYNNYLLFEKNEINKDKINNIYLQLEEKVPKEFIGWNLFNDNIYNS